MPMENAGSRTKLSIFFFDHVVGGCGREARSGGIRSSPSCAGGGTKEESSKPSAWDPEPSFHAHLFRDSRCAPPRDDFVRSFSSPQPSPQPPLAAPSTQGSMPEPVSHSRRARSRRGRIRGRIVVRRRADRARSPGVRSARMPETGCAPSWTTNRSKRRRCSGTRRATQSLRRKVSRVCSGRFRGIARGARGILRSRAGIASDMRSIIGAGGGTAARDGTTGAASMAIA